MASFKIDGRSFNGRNISIINGRVTIDGVTVDGELSGVVEIKITEGVIERLETDAAVTCGDVRGGVKAGMQVTCGDVTGDVRSGMEVRCGNVGGNVDAGMNVECGTVAGSVDASMGVKMKR